jgi:hypothetical protein
MEVGVDEGVKSGAVWFNYTARRQVLCISTTLNDR